jgi:hypothetical protein
MAFRKNFFTALFTLFALASFAQTKTHYTKTEMKKNPVWIEMINDEHVNYFEALKAFELYFATHRFPVMEEEEMGKNEKLKERIEKSEAKYKKKKRKIKADPDAAQKEKHEEAKLAFEVKKFNHWEMQTRPYAKNDGSIMSAEERMKIWKESRGK